MFPITFPLTPNVHANKKPRLGPEVMSNYS